MTTINLPARGLAYTMVDADHGTTFLMLTARGEPENPILDALLRELARLGEPAKVQRTNGDARLRLTNGTHLALRRIAQEGAHFLPNYVVVTEDAQREHAQSRGFIDIDPLLARSGAQLATY